MTRSVEDAAQRIFRRHQACGRLGPLPPGYWAPFGQQFSIEDARTIATGISCPLQRWALGDSANQSCVSADRLHWRSTGRVTNPGGFNAIRLNRGDRALCQARRSRAKEVDCAMFFYDAVQDSVQSLAKSRWAKHCTTVKCVEPHCHEHFRTHNMSPVVATPPAAAAECPPAAAASPPPPPPGRQPSVSPDPDEHVAVAPPGAAATRRSGRRTRPPTSFVAEPAQARASQESAPKRKRQDVVAAAPRRKRVQAAAPDEEESPTMGRPGWVVSAGRPRRPSPTFQDASGVLGGVSLSPSKIAAARFSRFKM